MWEHPLGNGGLSDNLSNLTNITQTKHFVVLSFSFLITLVTRIFKFPLTLAILNQCQKIGKGNM